MEWTVWHEVLAAAGMFVAIVGTLWVLMRASVKGLENRFDGVDKRLDVLTAEVASQREDLGILREDLGVLREDVGKLQVEVKYQGQVLMPIVESLVKAGVNADRAIAA